MAKSSSPTNLASAIICFFISKKFPLRLKASLGRFARQTPSPHPSFMVHVHEFFKVYLVVGCLSRNLVETLHILLVDAYIISGLSAKKSRQNSFSKCPFYFFSDFMHFATLKINKKKYFHGNKLRALGNSEISFF